MEYIAHRPFHRKALGGEVNIKRGETLQEKGGVLFYNGIPVCMVSCQAAKEHFSINNDGNGLCRGDLTYEIAFAKPLTELQKSILLSNPAMRKYLVGDERVILFNDTFFHASMLELWSIAGKLGISVYGANGRLASLACQSIGQTRYSLERR